MINDIEEVLCFNQTTPRHSRLKYRMKKNIKGLCFKEILLKINNRNKESGHKWNNSREHKKNNNKEVKIDYYNVEDTTELKHLDKFC